VPCRIVLFESEVCDKLKMWVEIETAEYLKGGKEGQ